MVVSSSSASKLTRADDGEKKKKKKWRKKVKRNNCIDCNCKTGLVVADQEHQTPPPPSSYPAKRRKAPGLRLVGSRIYDSENGKTCHQCRQKTMDFVASCKNQRDNKRCPVMFCYKCLLNRYGEEAEDVEVLDDWKCPKCRGICNCSFCMKKRGQQPTGILVHAAKATGFSSVSEMLHIEGPSKLDPTKILQEEQVVASKGKHRNGNSSDVKCDLNSEPSSLTRDGYKKKPGGSKPKNLAEQDCNDGVGKDNIDDNIVLILLKKNNHKKSRMYKKMVKEEGKADRRVDNEPLENLKSHLKVSKEISACPIEKEKKIDKRCSLFSACNEPGELENANIGGTNAKPKSVQGTCMMKKNTIKTPTEDSDTDIDIPSPWDIDLMTIAGIDLPANDVGHALQFLEFCAAFGHVLDLKKGQPESVLHEVVHGHNVCQGLSPSNIQFHIQLLSLIEKDSGLDDFASRSPSFSQKISEKSWLQALGKCITASKSALKDLPSFDSCGDGYDELDSSEKLRLLNFLCDEALGTISLRTWIDKQITKFEEGEKEAKEKVTAAKDMLDDMKKKLQNEVAKAVLLKNGSPLSVAEYEGLVLKIKAKAAQAHMEILEEMDMVPEKKQRSDAVRTEPIHSDGNGCIYWRLKGYTSDPTILLQDMRSGDLVAPEERWLTCRVEDTKASEEYIYSLRRKKLRHHMVHDTLFSGTIEVNEASAKHDTSVVSPP